MKNSGPPIRDSVPWNSQCKKDPRWLNNVLLFSTEIWAEQLKKAPCIFRMIEISSLSTHPIPNSLCPSFFVLYQFSISAVIPSPLQCPWCFYFLASWFVKDNKSDSKNYTYVYQNLPNRTHLPPARFINGPPPSPAQGSWYSPLLKSTEVESMFGFGIPLIFRLTRFSRLLCILV